MDKNDWSNIIKAAGLLSYLGIVMVVSIGIGYFLGSTLDRYLHTEPWMMILGLIVGVGAGFYGVYQIIKGVMADE